MLSIATLLMLIYGLATLIDVFLSTEAVQHYRKNALQIGKHIDILDPNAVSQALNARFLALFRLLYTDRLFSWQRMMRSIISSLLSVTVLWTLVALLEGRPVMEPAFGARGGMTSFVAFLAVNLLADYFSLQQTGWILRKSQRAGVIRLIMWTAVDLILTGVIFVTIFSILTFAVYGPFRIKSPGSIVSGIYFISTFVTSALWVGYFISAISAHLLKRLSRTFHIALETIGESERPARTTAGLIVLTLAPIYGLNWVSTLF